MLYEQVASLSTEQHYPAQYRNNSKTMCPRPAPGQKFTCNKNRFPIREFPIRELGFPNISWPKKDAEKKVEVTNKLPVLKF